MFGIGGSSSKSSSEASSYGYTGSRSDSLSTQQGSSRSGSSSSQDIAFKDLFARLYGGAASAAGGISGEGVKSAGDMLFSGGLGFLEALQGGDAALYLRDRVNGSSGVLDEQIGALKEDLGSFFRDELNPAITSQAVGGGQLGGGRQGVSQGIAVGKVSQEFQRGATALRSADQAQRDTAARDLFSLSNQGAAAGLSAIPGLLDTKSRAEMASLAPYQALAGILGGPTVLGESSSFGESSSEAVARSISESFGEDFSQSKSKGKSKSGSIGF